jgi:outer membrane protein assembly factor BamB
VIARGRIVILTGLALCALAGAARAAVPAWTTYRHDAAGSGIDPDSTSPVAPAQAWQAALDGKVYGEPLVYGSTVYAATENDTVYALNAATGAIAWQKHLATPVPSGQLPCGDISPTVGITSTPVLDPASGAIYVVAATWDGTSVKHQLFGLHLSDGSPVGGLPVIVDPPGSDPPAQLQRASLTLDAGKVIIGFGGNYGDCGSYHGWLVAVPEGGGPLQTFEVDKSTNQGAIWGAGNAPPVDSAGDIWTSTGNGSSSSFGLQESVIKLDANLNVLDHWAPSNWSSLDSSDTDLGSSMPLLLPGGLVFEMGKQGVGYLLSASNLGGTGGAPAYSASVCGGSWGGGIYLNGVIYVTCSNGLHALALNTTARTFAPMSGWTVNSNAVGPPIEAGGLVWSAGWNNGVLYGLDPASGATKFSASLGSFEHFVSPSAGGGRLFVGNGSALTAFQIAALPGVTPTTTTLASSANPALVGKAVAYRAVVTPAPDAGTVEFTDGATAIPGCAAVPISGSPGSAVATCAVSYFFASRHAIAATYSGDGSFGASRATLVEVVNAVAPVISHLQAGSVGRRLRLRLTISQPARLTIRVYRRTGRRLSRKATLTLVVRAGRDTLTPRMRALQPGRYVVTVVALTLAGGHSRTYTTTLAVPARHG